MHGTASGFPVAREAADASEVVPAGKGFSRPSDNRVFDRFELAGEPPFEQGEVVVALREQVVMGEQAAHVLHPQAARFLVQRLVAERNVAGSQAREQIADAGPAEPGQDTFGALGSAEGREQLCRCRFGARD